MKKNILTIIVIALCFVNVALTATVIFTVVPAVSKSNALITQVASIIDLELESPLPKSDVAITDMEAVALENSELTINLKSVEGELKDPYAVIDQVTVYLNKKGDDYKTLSEGIAGYGATITEVVSATFSEYTKDEVQNNRDLVKQEVLENLHIKFGSTTITDISFKNLRLQ